jgi:hypothetical protein
MSGPRDLAWHGVRTLDDEWLGMYYRSLRAGDTWHLKSWMKHLRRLGRGLTVLIRIKLKNLTDPFSTSSV